VNVAFWIAGRYLCTRRPTAFIALLTGISVAGVTVGVAALIAVLAPNPDRRHQRAQHRPLV
jgi:ABC-type lipoprotein release transport system permease subunit